MKTAILLLLLVLALVADGVLWQRVTAIERQLAARSADYPLGEMMGYMQRYADKLWFAGEAGNWELAGFYRGEIAETEEGIAQARVSKDGVEVSKLIRTIFPPAIEAVGKAVAAHDPAQFRQSYQTMIRTCNDCHDAAQHGFIRIAPPVGAPTYWNQSFAPAPAGKP